MTAYYLYVKTHNKTGLKYLGYTSARDPHKYTGSGKYWRNHLAKHGGDVSTEILIETADKSIISKMGIHYSELWDIVDSHEWANLQVENGTGGFDHLTAADFKKRYATRVKNGTQVANTPEIIVKMRETKRKNGTLGKSYVTSASQNRAAATRKEHGVPQLSVESIVKIRETKVRNGTTNSSSPESIAKGLATKTANGTLNARTPENIARQQQTRYERGLLPRSEECKRKISETKQRLRQRPICSTLQLLVKMKRVKIGKYAQKPDEWILNKIAELQLLPDWVSKYSTRDCATPSELVPLSSSILAAEGV